MATKAMTPEELRRQQQSLSEQVRQEQVRRAEQTRQENLRALAEQVRLQRQNMATGRQQLSEQAWSAQRNIEQQAQARGLGSSGLKNLSLVQSQMAQGRAASELESQNVNLQKAVMDARAGVTRQAESDIRSAELSARESLLGADREYMEADRMQKERALTLLQMAQSENMTPEILAKYAQYMGLEDEDVEAATEVAGLSGAPNMEDRTIKTKFGLESLLDPFTLFSSRQLQSEFGRMLYGEEFADFNYDPSDGERRAFQYNFLGKQISFRDKEHVKVYFENMYKDKQYSDLIQIEVTNTGAVRFNYDGKRYNTYNKAKNAVRGKSEDE